MKIADFWSCVGENNIVVFDRDLDNIQFFENYDVTYYPPFFEILDGLKNTMQ